MKIRTTIAAFVWFSIIGTPTALPFVVSAPFASSAFGQQAAPTPQTSSPRDPQQAVVPISLRETGGSLFENVVKVMQKKYYDERFRKEELPKLAAQYADKAKRATSLGEQRKIVQEFLSHVPASHLGLLSRATYRRVVDDLQGRAYPSFGFQITEVKGKFYAVMLLEKGPAEGAGLLTWDRIVSIDGVPVETSPRLDWRSDDAYIGDERDPAVHYIDAQKGDVVRFKVERQSGKFLDIAITAADYSAFGAAKASVQVYQQEGHRIGYLHLWYVHLSGVPEFLKEKLENDFRDCQALVIDLRGRGGNGNVIAKIIDLLRADRAAKNRPIVALVDRQSRSAKDVLAYEFKQTGVARLVGERSAGAVIPATFADVGYDSILMFPSFKLPRYTDLLEFKPVEPDVFVERAGPLSAGHDPILKAGLAEAVKMLKTAAKPASVK